MHGFFNNRSETKFFYMISEENVLTILLSLHKYPIAAPLKVSWGNGIMISVSVCQEGHPGSSPARFVCFRKVEFHQCVFNLSPPVPTTGSPKAVHVLSCLCDHTCKRSLAICCKSRALFPVSRLLSVPI